MGIEFSFTAHLSHLYGSLLNRSPQDLTTGDIDGVNNFQTTLGVFLMPFSSQLCGKVYLSTHRLLFFIFRQRRCLCPFPLLVDILSLVPVRGHCREHRYRLPAAYKLGGTPLLVFAVIPSANAHSSWQTKADLPNHVSFTTQGIETKYTRIKPPAVASR